MERLCECRGDGSEERPIDAYVVMVVVMVVMHTFHANANHRLREGTLQASLVSFSGIAIISGLAQYPSRILPLTDSPLLGSTGGFGATNTQTNAFGATQARPTFGAAGSTGGLFGGNTGKPITAPPSPIPRN